MIVDNQLTAVITSYNQGEMISEALQSVLNQTILPEKIIIVDDGSTDEKSVAILNKIEQTNYEVKVVIIRQENCGVSAARNCGISKATTPYVLVLDGDDKLDETYVEKTTEVIRSDRSLVAISSWMRCFGFIDSEVHPEGGRIQAFLSHNCCPATHILKKTAWEICGGYDENMKEGFEDWDFFISMLETETDACIEVIKEPLILYRTAAASSNVRSMDKRIELMRYLIQKHKSSYEKNVEEVVLGVEQISINRLFGWESEMVYHENLSEESKAFLKNPTYGDGGMAAAVRVNSYKKN